MVWIIPLTYKRSGHVRSRSYDVGKRYNLRPILEKSWDNATWSGAIDSNGDSWSDLCPYMTICDPWHHLLRVSRSSKVNRGHCPRLTPQWPTVAWHMFSGVSWGPASEISGLFVSKNISKPLYHRFVVQSFPFIQSEFWPVCRSRSTRVMFCLGALQTLNIVTKYSKDSLYCSELSGKHAVKVSDR